MGSNKKKDDSSPKNKKNKSLKFRMPRNWIWVVVFVVQLGVLYGLTRWGYHTSRLPYWFDNFVQDTGVWRIYGKKVYGDDVNGVFWVDPRLNSVSVKNVVQDFEGRLSRIEVRDDSTQVWTIESVKYGEKEYLVEIDDDTSVSVSCYVCGLYYEGDTCDCVDDEFVGGVGKESLEVGRRVEGRNIFRFDKKNNITLLRTKYVVVL